MLLWFHLLNHNWGTVTTTAQLQCLLTMVHVAMFHLSYANCSLLRIKQAVTNRTLVNTLQFMCLSFLSHNYSGLGTSHQSVIRRIMLNYINDRQCLCWINLAGVSTGKIDLWVFHFQLTKSTCTSCQVIIWGGADENNLKMIAYEHYWTSKWLHVYGVKPYLSLIIFIQV